MNIPDRVSSGSAGTGGSTINISNTGWERAVDELKKELTTLKVEGNVNALKAMLDQVSKDRDSSKQSEMVKEKELHRLQDMYAEEIRKHTEDTAKVQKVQDELNTLQQTSSAQIRAAQEEKEQAAAEALAKIEELQAAAAAKPKKKKKKKKKKATKAKK